jgi:hypothetical protein
MAAFPKRFTDATRDEQFRIIDLGILLLDLIGEQQPNPNGEQEQDQQEKVKHALKETKLMHEECQRVTQGFDLAIQEINLGFYKF